MSQRLVGDIYFDKRKLIKYIVFRYSGFNYPEPYDLFSRQVLWFAVEDYLNYDVFSILAGYYDDGLQPVFRSTSLDLINLSKQQSFELERYVSGEQCLLRELQKFGQCLVYNTIQCPLDSNFKFCKLDKSKVVRYYGGYYLENEYDVDNNGNILQKQCMMETNIDYSNNKISFKDFINDTVRLFDHLVAHPNEILGLVMECYYLHDFMLLCRVREYYLFNGEVMLNHGLGEPRPKFFTLTPHKGLSGGISRSFNFTSDWKTVNRSNNKSKKRSFSECEGYYNGDQEEIYKYGRYKHEEAEEEL